MTDRADELARGIAAEFRRRMAEEYVPRIGKCVARLSPEQVWSRPGPTSNSIGNLLLHLEGNVRQWIQAGVRGDADGRDRPAEFAATDSAVPPGELFERLRATVDEACAVVAELDGAGLLESRRFQGRYDETVLAGVLHVMEHFSGHAGQIYAFTKLALGVDLAHYDL